MFVRKKLQAALRAQPSQDMWFAQGLLKIKVYVNCIPFGFYFKSTALHLAYQEIDLT